MNRTPASTQHLHLMHRLHYLVQVDPAEPGGLCRSFREGNPFPEEPANRKVDDVPQGNTLSLSLTVLLQDRGSGLCEGPSKWEDAGSDW